jgi:hypothetical protein
VNPILEAPIENLLMKVDSGNLIKILPVKKTEIFKEDILPVNDKKEVTLDKILHTARVVNSSANQNNESIKPIGKWVELNTIKKPESYKFILRKDIFDDERPIGKAMWVILTDVVNDNNLMQAEELIATDIRKINRIPKSTFQYEKVAEKRYYEIREVLLEREKRTSRQNPEEYAKEVRSKMLFSEKEKNRFLDMVDNPYRTTGQYLCGR